MVDTETLQQEQIFAEFQLLIFSVIFYSCTRTSDGPNCSSTLVVFSLTNEFFAEARSVCPQFVRTAVTPGDLFYIFRLSAQSRT